MPLKLSKPLCFFDLETTGNVIGKDKIVEIAVLKLFPNQQQQRKRWLIHPQQPIPAQATQIHGITDEIVKDCPPFKEVASEIYHFMKDADWAGYNSNRFDVPMLVEEFLRAGVDVDLKNVRLIDVKVIFYKMEQRTLSAAYKFYCNKELENAHSAMADVQATYEVLLGQLEKYPDLENSVSYLSELSTQKNTADFAGFILYDDLGREVFSFGKYKGELVEDVLEKDPGYYGWIQNSDFPLYTKKVLTAIQLRKLNSKSF